MKLPTLILDFSGVYPDIALAAELEASGCAETVTTLSLQGIEGCCCYCDTDAAEAIRAAISSHAEPLHWIDSGDYHYVSKLFAERLTQPFTLVLFDNHPDDQAPEFPGVLSCGSWVRALREECPLLEGVVSLGPDGVFPDSLAALDGKDVYVSIDKDVLGPEWARTDWSQGRLSLPGLETLLGEVFDRAGKVLGIDVCGELPASKGGHAEDFRINLSTDLSLQRFISNHIKH